AAAVHNAPPPPVDPLAAIALNRATVTLAAAPVDMVPRGVRNTVAVASGQGSRDSHGRSLLRCYAISILQMLASSPRVVHYLGMLRDLDDESVAHVAVFCETLFKLFGARASDSDDTLSSTAPLDAGEL